ncbi:hypothetical protein ACQP06_12925 [Nocardia sp. CA-136227]|uniref:hypothetical protein n=1 Tax=Nocardia sp. CA-136227 TaxID=3239979 RepID=UPI003D98E20A
MITTSRVVFTGSRSTREWRFDKLVSVDTDPDEAAVLLHVANRQKVSGLLPGNNSPTLQTYLDLGLAISERGPEAVARELQATANPHMASQPQPPAV